MERLLVFMSYYSQQVKQIKMGKSQGGGLVAVFIFNESLLSFLIAQSPLFNGQNLFHFMNMVYILASLYKTDKNVPEQYSMSVL